MKEKVLTLDIKLIIQIVVIAIYLIGCSGANTVSTLEATPTDIPTLIPTTTNTPLPPTKISTHTPIPPSPTKEGKPDEYYQQLSKDLETFHLLVQSMESPTGLKIKNFDTSTYESGKLQEGISKFLELACNKPELLENIKIEPFLLSNNVGSGGGKPGENLKINVQACEFTKETLLKLEEMGLTIILAQPVFEHGDNIPIEEAFPGIKSIAEFDAQGNPTGVKKLGVYWYNGLVLGNRDFSTLSAGVMDIFINRFNTGEFSFFKATFSKGVTHFQIPTDSESNMIFSSIMVFPSNMTPEEIDRFILQGTLSHQVFNNAMEFTSESLSE